MPWVLCEHLPLIRYALPARFTVYMFLASAIMGAIWAARWNGKLQIKVILGVLIVLSLMPDLGKDSWIQHPSKVTPPHFFTSDTYKKYIIPKETVIILPYGPRIEHSMLLQAWTNMYFRMAGGHLGIIPKNFGKLKVVQMLYQGPDKKQIDAFSVFCKANNITKVIVIQKQYQDIWGPWLKMGGWELMRKGNVAIFCNPNIFPKNCAKVLPASNSNHTEVLLRDTVRSRAYCPSISALTNLSYNLLHNRAKCVVQADPQGKSHQPA